jgi:hypothetical protein
MDANSLLPFISFAAVLTAGLTIAGHYLHPPRPHHHWAAVLAGRRYFPGTAG